MTEPNSRPPHLGSYSGHTAQYMTLAMALRNSIEAMELDVARLERKQLAISAASLTIEAHCATITVLSAALCENVANTILATLMDSNAFLESEKIPMPKKWSQTIPELLNCSPPDPKLLRELGLLHQVRTSIVHAKATIYSSGDIVHIEGNDSRWVHLTPEIARSFSRLPLSLVNAVPLTVDYLLLGIGSTLRECQPRQPVNHLASILTSLEMLDPSQLNSVHVAVKKLSEKARG